MHPESCLMGWCPQICIDPELPAWLHPYKGTLQQNSRFPSLKFCAKQRETRTNLWFQFNKSTSGCQSNLGWEKCRMLRWSLTYSHWQHRWTWWIYGKFTSRDDMTERPDSPSDFLDSNPSFILISCINLDTRLNLYLSFWCFISCMISSINVIIFIIEIQSIWSP